MPSKAKLTTRSISTSTVTTDTLPKNSGLTNAELDSNFLNLRDQTFGIVGDDSTGIDVQMGDTIKFTGAGGATVTVVGDTVTITAGGGGGGDIGDLTVVGSTITAPSDGDLGLTTSGTGYVHVKDKFAVAQEIYFDDYGDAAVEPPGNGQRMKILDDSISFNEGRASIDSIIVYARSSGDANILDIDSTSTNTLKIHGLTYPSTDGTTGQVLTTNGSGVLSWTSPTAVGDITIVGDDSTGTAVSLGETFKIAGAGGVTTAVSGDTLTITGGSVSSLGNLQVTGTNSQTIQGTVSDAPIILQPNAAGYIHLNSNDIKFGIENQDTMLFSSGQGDIKIRPEDSDLTNPTLILEAGQSPNPGNIILNSAPNQSASQIQLNGTDGTTFNSRLNIFEATITTEQANGNIVITPNGTGKIQLDNNYWPNADGTAGQILQTDGAGVLDWINSTLTMVGDDSTGTQVNLGETFKFAGTQNITTAVSGDTLTITGPDLSSYLTSVAFGDLTSTPTTLSGYGITDAVASGSAALTLVGDDSTGTTVNIGETFKIAGTQNVTTAVANDILTITGPDLSSYLTDIVDDATPQLGGDLDVNGNDIVSVSNGNIKILPNGTGRAILGTDPTVSTGFYGNNSVYGAQMNYQDADWNAATGPQYPSPLTRSTDWTLDASTTTAGRIRVLDAVELDMAGYDWNFSTDFYEGPQQQKSIVLKNTGSSASNTLDNAIVNFNKAEILGSGSNNSTITVNQVFGERIQTIASQDSGDTANIGTNYGLHYQSPGNFGSGTLNVTNEYGVYVDMSGSTATNNDAIRITGNPDHGVYFTGTSSSSYGFRTDSNAPNNRIGGLQFQFNRIKFPSASDPSTVSTLAWLYAKNSTGTMELYVKDGAGNITQLSPHNAEGEWEYFSRNTETGKVVRINMEEMIRDIEQLTGKTYIKNE